MISAEFPENEEMRLFDLASYDLQDEDTEEEFDQLSQLMAQYFKCPIALVTVIDRDHQWFKGKAGTNETGNLRSLSFCSHTFLINDVMVVEDASKDKRFFDNPVVTGFNIRFYAGASIVSTDGYKLGTVCIYDTRPRKLIQSKRNTLILFSKLVTRLLELRKKNLLLRQRAQEMISFKNDIFGRFIQRQETDNKSIAFNLHENFAQGIAAVLMILQMARKKGTGGSVLLDSAVVQLKEMIVNIRNLSYSITPPIPDWISGEQLLTEFVEKIATTYPFKLSIENTGETKKISTDITLCSIRIIDQWLKVLLKKKNIHQVQVSLAYAEQFILSISDDGAMETMNDRRKELFENIVYDRARALGGTVELSLTATGGNLLEVLLPFTKPAAG